MASLPSSQTQNCRAQTSRAPEDWDFFEFPRAKLPNKRPVLSRSSSSDEEEFTSGTETDDDDPDAVSMDLYTKLQRQFSTLTVQINSITNNRPRPPRMVPSKYLFDETARRWALKPTPGLEQLPQPKHQDGRSKIQQQKSSTVRQTALSFWQYFMPDRFLELNVLKWFDNKRSGDQNLAATGGKSMGKGTATKEKPGSTQKANLIDLDELKAFFAILYARAVYGDPSSLFETTAWSNDAFTPPFFAGTMQKERFFDLLKGYLFGDQNEPSSAFGQRDFAAVTYLTTEFGYRCTQFFDPGDTLVVTDRTVSLNCRISQSPFLSPGGERIILKKFTISWLRDARCGYFIKAAPPSHDHSTNDIIIDMARLQNADTIKHVRMDEAMRVLLGQPPISQSGRTIFVGPLHAGVDSASELYEKHRLRIVGQLPSSGSIDCRVPFVAKSRSLLKRPIGSSLFLFDNPLTLISYQRRPAMRTPDMLISTAHRAKEKASTDDPAQASAQSKQPPPSAWMDYQGFYKDFPKSTSNFCSLFVGRDEIRNVPLERIVFLDCLYAAAYNAFILWKLEQPTKKQSDLSVLQLEFKQFLKRLACHLAKPYISRRLAVTDDVDGAPSWRFAAKQVLRDLEQCGESSAGDSAIAKASSPHDASPSQTPGEDEAGQGSAKKTQKKQAKKPKGKGRK